MPHNFIRFANPAVRFNLFDIMRDTLGSFFTTKNDIRNHVQKYIDNDKRLNRELILNQKSTKLALSTAYAGILKAIYLSANMLPTFFTDIPKVDEIPYDSDIAYTEMQSIDKYVPINKFIHDHVISTRDIDGTSQKFSGDDLDKQCAEAGTKIAEMRMSFVNVSLAVYQWNVTNLLAKRDANPGKNVEDIPIDKFTKHNKNVAIESMIKKSDDLCKNELKYAVGVAAISSEVKDKLSSLLNTIDSSNLDKTSINSFINEKDKLIWQHDVLEIFDKKYKIINPELAKFKSLSEFENSIKINKFDFLQISTIKSDLISITKFIKEKLFAELGGGMNDDLREELVSTQDIIKKFVVTYFDYREAFIQNKLLGMHWIIPIESLPTNLTADSGYMVAIRTLINDTLIGSCKMPKVARKIRPIVFAIKKHDINDLNSTEFTHDKVDASSTVKYATPSFEPKSFLALLQKSFNEAISIMVGQYKSRIDQFEKIANSLNELHILAKNPSKSLSVVELYEFFIQQGIVSRIDTSESSLFAKAKTDETFNKYDDTIIKEFVNKLNQTTFSGLDSKLIEHLLIVLIASITKNEKIESLKNGAIPMNNDKYKKEEKEKSKKRKRVIVKKDTQDNISTAGMPGDAIQSGVKLKLIRQSLFKSVRLTKKPVAEKQKIIDFISNMPDADISILYKNTQKPSEIISIINKLIEKQST